MPIRIEEALADWLIDDYRKPGINRNRLEEEIYKIYMGRTYKGEKVVQLRTDNPRSRQFKNCINKLEKIGIIEPIDNPSIGWMSQEESNYFFVSPYKDRPHSEIVCSLYPYGNISHLSALSWYGITDRIPKKIYYTSPSRSLWKSKSIVEITERIKTHSRAADFIPFFPKTMKLAGYDFKVFETRDYVEPMEAEGGVRVTSIGQLFIEITRRPEFSGGESNVISAYREYGKSFSKKIINQVEKSGNDIDKARVGFFLENISEVDSSNIECWKESQKNKRGGSRKLSHRNDFSACYSPSWGLSINIKELEAYGIRDK